MNVSFTGIKNVGTLTFSVDGIYKKVTRMIAVLDGEDLVNFKKMLRDNDFNTKLKNDVLQIDAFEDRDPNFPARNLNNITINTENLLPDPRDLTVLHKTSKLLQKIFMRIDEELAVSSDYIYNREFAQNSIEVVKGDQIAINHTPPEVIHNPDNVRANAFTIFSVIENTIDEIRTMLT
ncbi:MAG: hypothetical protein WCY19_00665 [Candidatus Gastranaerophilaceae bacterium]